MGEAQRRKREIEELRKVSFPTPLVQVWEAENCLSFAVALARRTRWLLHVDWLTEDIEDFEACKTKIQIRAYVGTDQELIFDPRGVFTLGSFIERVVQPLVQQRSPGPGRWRCRKAHAGAVPG